MTTLDSPSIEIRWDGPRATLLINGAESSCIDTSDPSYLDFEYMQHATCALQAPYAANDPLRVLHLGGAACALPWAWAILFPASRHTVVEVDQTIAQFARDHFDLPRSPILKIRIGEARQVIDSLRDSSFDVIVRDAFAGESVPPQLRTIEFAAQCQRVLRKDGILLENSAHGGGDNARLDLAGMSESFADVQALCDPKVGRGARRGNIVFLAQTTPGHTDEVELDRLLRKLPLPARPLRGKELSKWRAGTRPLTDEAVGWTQSAL